MSIPPSRSWYNDNAHFRMAEDAYYQQQQQQLQQQIQRDFEIAEQVRNQSNQYYDYENNYSAQNASSYSGNTGDNDGIFAFLMFFIIISVGIVGFGFSQNWFNNSPNKPHTYPSRSFNNPSYYGSKYSANRYILQSNTGEYPQTQTRFLTKAEIQRWTNQKVQDAINEMLARHGYPFRGTKFTKYNWYKPIPGLTENEILGKLSTIEAHNFKLLVARRDQTAKKTLKINSRTHDPFASR